jgi:hypothetical protein
VHVDRHVEGWMYDGASYRVHNELPVDKPTDIPTEVPLAHAVDHQQARRYGQGDFRGGVDCERVSCCRSKKTVTKNNAYKKAEARQIQFVSLSLSQARYEYITKGHQS